MGWEGPPPHSAPDPPQCRQVPAGQRLLPAVQEHLSGGCGFPARVLLTTEREAVLRRVYRTEKSRHAPGSGLGLSLVAAVARLHGLHLAIDDAEPGCRVTVWRDGLLSAPLQARQHQPVSML
jgi:hypothetical protein